MLSPTPGVVAPQGLVELVGRQGDATRHLLVSLDARLQTQLRYGFSACLALCSSTGLPCMPAAPKQALHVPGKAGARPNRRAGTSAGVLRGQRMACSTPGAPPPPCSCRPAHTDPPPRRATRSSLCHWCAYSPLEVLTGQLLQRALPHKWEQQMLAASTAAELRRRQQGQAGAPWPPTRRAQPRGGAEGQGAAEGGAGVQEGGEAEAQKRREEEAARAAAVAALLEAEEREREKQVGRGA